MQAEPATHPHLEQLSDFALGRLESAALDAVESHLATCPECCDTLNQIKEDTFVGLVRQAKDEAPAATDMDASALAEAQKLGQTLQERRNVLDELASSLAEAGTLAHVPPESAATGATEPAAAFHVTDIPTDLANHTRYRIEELIGVGGMGAVYKAEHRMMKRPVALKVINPKFIQSKQAAERFRREVEAAGRLVHPNIVHSYDAEQAGDVHFLVMEYVKGTDLQKVLEQRGPLPVAEACEYIRQAAVGLQHAHESGMVHRDIKPQNLMLSVVSGQWSVAKDKPASADGPRTTDYGQIKILDFGLASLTEAAAEDGAETQSATLDSQKSGLTQAGVLMGTPDYMAPEQAKDARSADIRSDIYSLGCTLYTLLAGNVPYPGGTAIDKVIAHSTTQPKPIGEVRKDVPAGVVRVLDKMMAKDPAARYQTPAEVATALAPLSRYSGRGVGGEGGSRRLTLVATLVATAAIILAGIIYIATDNGQLVIDTKVDDVMVVIHKGGQQFDVIDLKTGSKVKRLPSGEYTISLKGNDAGVIFDKQDGFTMTRWGQVTVTMTRRDTPLAEVRRFEGHTGPVSCVAFSPNGDRAVTGSGDHFGNTDLTARIWDVRTGKELHRLQGHQGAIRAVAFSHDGRRVLTGAWDATVRLWDADTGKEIHRFDDPGILIHGVAISRDGKWAVSGGHVPNGGKPGDMGSVRLWDLDKKVAKGTGGRQPFQVWEVAISPDDKQVLLSCHDGNARLWDVTTGAEIRKLEGHTHFVNAVKFSPDGHKALTGSTDQTLRLWDVDTGKQLLRMDGHAGDVSGVAFTKDGRRAVSVGPDRALRLWDLETGKQLGNAPGHTEWIFGVACSPDGGHALTASYDKTVRLWRLPGTDKVTDQPPPAIAPFNVANAREHQDAWAKHLGVDVEIHNSLGMRLRLISPGEFMMGSSAAEIKGLRDAMAKLPELKTWMNTPDAETPQHLVKLTKPYRIAAHEVTLAQFRRFVEATQYQTDAERDGKGGGFIDPKTSQWSNDPKTNWRKPGSYEARDNYPVVQVSWNDAKAFCDWLSKQEGVEYRLPTEAEWEFACRAGSASRFSFGDDPDGFPHYAVTGARPHPEPVGSPKPNAFGLYDMEGNASEWCLDWFKPGYNAWTQTDPSGPDAATPQRTHRGGAFNYPGLLCRPAIREGDTPTARTLNTGFRVVMVGDLISRDDKEKTALANWQGTWSVGPTSPIEISRAEKLTIAGNRWSWGESNGPLRIISVGEKSSAVDFVFDTGNTKGRTVYAILKREGDTLHYCATNALPRPTEFRGVNVAPHPYVAYIEWQRVQAADLPKAGWTQLFNGKHQDGWNVIGGQPGAWNVVEGLLVGNAGPLPLYTIDRTYSDFHLRMEARINVSADLGIYFRLKKPGPSFLHNYFHGYGVGIQAPQMGGKTGGIIAGLKEKVPPAKKVLDDETLHEFFIIEVIARKNRFIVKVNGETTADVVDPDNKYPEGYFGLRQINPGTHVMIRKIEVKELRPKADKEFILGAWKPVSAEAFGQPVPQALIDLMQPTITFTPDKLTAKVNLDKMPVPIDMLKKLLLGFDEKEKTLAPKELATVMEKQGVEAVYTIDPTKTPPTINISYLSPVRKTLLGIYSIEGDTLKICVAVEPERAEERPTEFAGKAGQVLGILKRQQK